MPADATAPLVSINIPCYRQPRYARRCLEAILAQTFGDFEVTLFDDGDSGEYAQLVSSLGDGRVRYIANAERLGAIGNMFHAIRAGRGRYVLAFHEDDLLSRGYLAAAVGFLESHADCAFVAAEIREFPAGGEPARADLDREAADPNVAEFRSGADLLRGILGGVEPMFGSVVYRRSALGDARAEHDHFATLLDRPFLLSMLERWSGAVIRSPQMAWYRQHAGEDARHLAMTADHVLHLFERYRATLSSPLTASDRNLFYGYAGYWLPTLVELARPDGRPSMRRVIFRAVRGRLYDVRWAGRYGRRRLIRSAFFPGGAA